MNMGLDSSEFTNIVPASSKQPGPITRYTIRLEVFQIVEMTAG